MSKQSIEEFLSAHAFFSKMDASFLKFLADSVTELQIKQGGVLFKHGNRADKFYLLRTGQVSIQVPAVMGAALEDSDLLEFDGSAILARCEDDPKFGYDLFKRFAALMSERLDAARQKMMDEWNPPGFA